MLDNHPTAKEIDIPIVNEIIYCDLCFFIYSKANRKKPFLIIVLLNITIEVVSLSHMDTTHFISETASPIIFKTSWQAPSNIALVKYWGKYESQLPKNPSLSFTLSSCITETNVEFLPHKKKHFDFEFYFDDALKSEFKPKLTTFFDRINQYIPWVSNYKMKIYSKNSFPHSSGIASSASSMAALSLCLMDLERELFPSISINFFNQKASFLSRLGSGSAARSIKGPVTIWGENKFLNSSSNLYAISFEDDLHPIFKNYQDTILIIDKGSKLVSSSQGHNLMHGHPFAENRFNQASKHLLELISVLKTGDLGSFMNIVELEALSLHSMMMTSDPYFILMQPNTLAIIQKIWEFRKSTNIPLCFTLDAGANVHLLYPKINKFEIHKFIKKELLMFCQDENYIQDEVGGGAKKM